MQKNRRLLNNYFVGVLVLIALPFYVKGQMNNIPDAVFKKLNKEKFSQSLVSKTFKGTIHVDSLGRGIDYFYEIAVDSTGRLSGKINTKFTDTLMSENEVAISSVVNLIDAPTLFCCASNTLLCVPWEDRKKHPECKYWKIASKK